MKTQTTLPLLSLALGITLTLPTGTTLAQGTAFTYQGRLDSGGTPFNGSAEFQATLWDAATGGTQVAANKLGAVVVGVTNGLFTLPLDFDGKFTGADRWLQLEVRTSIGPFTTLNPRQALTPTPYALTAKEISGLLPTSQLSGTLSSAQLGGTYSGAVTFNNAGNTFKGDGSGLKGVNATTVGGVSATNLWKLSGNSGVGSGQFLGTTDNRPLELRVNGLRALRLEPGPLTNGAPNVIAGSPANYVSNHVVGATIAGGGTTNYYGSPTPNIVTANYGTVGGGGDNTASGTVSTVAGGWDNTASGLTSTVAGGGANRAHGADSTVGGGYGNIASGASSTVGGGNNNTASYFHSTVGGGYGNIASGETSTVGGGVENLAGGIRATVGGGSYNTASGYGSTVAGGSGNTASADYSFAIGNIAKAQHRRSFVWSDGSDSTTSTKANQFVARASGGYMLFSSSGNTGVSLASGSGSWASMSDRNAKDGFEAVDTQEVLAQVAALPLTSWSYKTEAGVRHMGPMAQDFYAAFGLGADDKHIATVDADGVALAAIQGLNQKLEAKSQAAAERIYQLETENTELKQRLERLEYLLINKPNGERP
ncbi:MAG TPA: tail fiber domain-containing protein [Verrucomicrobiota bacterium]|jgi:hypothetical protein|nr:tail fiber domain-containing protein [Verrucomicrobiota bacterium]HQB15232.1 tail fiber domain-containing protein [Verrucomicrobiota bacterium]